MNFDQEPSDMLQRQVAQEIINSADITSESCRRAIHFLTDAVMKKVYSLFGLSLTTIEQCHLRQITEDVIFCCKQLQSFDEECPYFVHREIMYRFFLQEYGEDARILLKSLYQDSILAHHADMEKSWRQRISRSYPTQVYLRRLQRSMHNEGLPPPNSPTFDSKND